MVEIIKRGELPEARRFQPTCPRCKTEFSFVAAEARFVPDQRDGDFYQIACPVCTSPVTVSAGGGRGWRDR